MLHGSYSICDIQDYFEFIIKKYEILAENPPIQIYPNKIKNRIVFKVKAGNNLEFLSPETMKLLGSTKRDVHKDKNGEDVPKLESVEVVLLHCNLVNNSYQHASKVLLTFVPIIQFGQLITISYYWYSLDKTGHEGIEIENVTAQFGLKQIIKEPTHISNTSSSCIDLIFTSQPNLITDSGVHSSLHSNCHHQIVFAKFNLHVVYPPPYLREI